MMTMMMIRIALLAVNVTKFMQSLLLLRIGHMLPVQFDMLCSLVSIISQYKGKSISVFN